MINQKTFRVKSGVFEWEDQRKRHIDRGADREREREMKERERERDAWMEETREANTEGDAEEKETSEHSSQRGQATR